MDRWDFPAVHLRNIPQMHHVGKVPFGYGDGRFFNLAGHPDASNVHLFEGRVDGTIATERTGTGGFGYDPLFVPEGYNQSFAVLGDAVKNTISHRARAVQQLAQFLLSQNI